MKVGKGISKLVNIYPLKVRLDINIGLAVSHRI